MSDTLQFMDLGTFILYTLKIGKAPPEDFEEVVGLGGSTAYIVVYLANVAPVFLVILPFFFLFPSLGQWLKALTPASLILAIFLMMVPIAIVRTLIFILLWKCFRPN